MKKLFLIFFCMLFPLLSCGQTKNCNCVVENCNAKDSDSNGEGAKDSNEEDKDDNGDATDCNGKDKNGNVEKNGTGKKKGNGRDKHTTKNEKNSKEEPPKIGNFSLPLSQQPGSLIGIGQNILNKNQAQLYLFADYFKGVRQHMLDIMPSFLYGITDNFSIFITLPIAASYKYEDNHSSGLGDASFQFEYAYYTKDTKKYSEEATIIANFILPTGSSKKQPPTGFGSPSFMLGTGYARTYVDWFGYTFQGTIQTTSHDGTKLGNEYLYQFGLGRNVLTIPSKLIFALQVEVDGEYTEKDRINGVTDPNSGGNVVFVTPSLWVSSKKLIFQFGVGFPVIQNLNGNQNKMNYLLAANLGWTL